MDKNVLKVKNIYKIIDKKKIISDVSFSLNEGEILGLIGPNGAGKTTIIKMIVNLKKTTNGEIHIKNKNIESNFEEAIEEVGAIIENPEFYNFMSAYDNLLCFAKMYKKISKARIEEVINLVGLKERIFDKVSDYSLGMRQRLAIAQAILHKPSLLILDEPTNGLDPIGIKELREYLIKITKEEKMSVLISSHILSEMESMCDKIVFINKGITINEFNMKDYNKLNNTFSFEIEPNDDINRKLCNIDFNCKFSLTENFIKFNSKKENIPLINSKLVSSGIKVYGINHLTKSIEDMFIEFVGGDGNDKIN